VYPFFFKIKAVKSFENRMYRTIQTFVLKLLPDVSATTLFNNCNPWSKVRKEAFPRNYIGNQLLLCFNLWEKLSL
jgi:hypothetical protein